MKVTLSSEAICSQSVIFSEQKRRPSLNKLLGEKRHLYVPSEFRNFNSLSKGKRIIETGNFLSSLLQKPISAHL